MGKIRIAAVIAILAVLVLVVTPVMAIDNPDSTPTVYRLFVNRNLIESGDAFFYGEYYIPYASPPDDGADETYIIRLMDTDGTTEIGSITPHVYFDNGYNYGAFSLYFETGIAWDSAYILRISQNPAKFPTAQSWDYALNVGDYSDETTQDANQLEVAINVITIAGHLEQYFPAYSLLEASAGGTVLSSPQGESYFRSAMPGIQALAPSLFLVQLLDIDWEEREWSTEQFDTYENRFDGTWTGNATASTASQFGLTPTGIMAAIVLFPLSIGAIFISSRKYKRVEPGLIVVIVFMIMAVTMGWMHKGLFAAVFQLSGIYIAYLWFYARG